MRAASGLNNSTGPILPSQNKHKPFNELLINLVINFVNLKNVYNKSECKIKKWLLLLLNILNRRILL
jgi:hypothetical protein